MKNALLIRKRAVQINGREGETATFIERNFLSFGLSPPVSARVISNVGRFVVNSTSQKLGQMIRNNSTSKIVQIIPILGILVILAVQYFHANQQLQANDELVKRQLENLKTDMRKDNVPPNIEGHISTVAENAAFQTHLLVSSLTTMQVFFQANILLMVYLFYTIQNKKTKKTED
ncbi:MAG TPA: hypothetical protein VF556_16345 [Pyrinomonadaceae bacterium]|jgi:hypothetical protein